MTPRISLLVAARHGADALRGTLASVLRQDARDWEVVVAQPPAPRAEDGAAVASAPDEPPGSTVDERVRHVEVVGGDDPDGDLAPLLQAALAAARGELVAVLEAGDLLEPGALGAALVVLDADPELDVVYTDEQWPAPGAEGIATKPDWSPLHLQSTPYLGRLCLVRASVVRAVGGFRPGYPGAEEWDLALRVAERTERVGHAPVVALTRPAPPRDDAVATAAGVRAVQGRVDRSGRPGRVEPAGVPRGVHVWWDGPPDPLVSVVIPTAGGRREVRGEDVVLVEHCLRSLVERTTYPHWEAVVVTSAHTPAGTEDALRSIAGDRVRFAPISGPFNFSASVNEGVRHAAGEWVLLLNDDTEVIEPRWLDRMVSVARDPAVGVVGAKLLFEDGRLQHVGVQVGDNWGPIHGYMFEPDDDADHGRKQLDMDVLVVTGACLLIPRDLFVQVGGMTTDLPLNFNDVDLCLKVVAAGRRVVCTPFARLHHFESSTRVSTVRDEEARYLWRHWGLRLATDPHVEFRSLR